MKPSEQECIICGEKGCDAEMFDPIIHTGWVDDEQAVREKLAGFVHAECGLQRGWEVA